MPQVRYDLQILLDDISRVGEIVGHAPLMREYKEHGRFHYWTICKQTRGWQLALHLAGFTPVQDDWNIDMLTPEQGGWLAGISSGEASFFMTSQIGKSRRISFKCSYAVRLRADDIGVLERIKYLWKIHHKISLSTLNRLAHQGYISNPSAMLDISDVLSLSKRVVPTFERYPLYSKKQDDFELFREAVTILENKHLDFRAAFRFSDDECKRLEEIRLKLSAVKKYTTKRH